MSENVNREIKRSKQLVYRKAYIKRRLSTTGLFESSWFEITDDIKRWGKVQIDTDSTRPGKFKFSASKLTVANDTGKYNESDSDNSLWNGYLDRQRTLFKIETGFVHETQASDLIWSRRVYPGGATWDEAQFEVDEWDDGVNTVFTGILQGDMTLSDKNDVALNIKPLNQVFYDFSASNLTGWTTTGMTASQFMTMVRDMTSGGQYVFRPFFGDTTTNWVISTTTSNYSTLNTSGAAQVRDSNVWEIMEKLAEAEGFVVYVSKDGVFNFKNKDVNTSTVAFEFHGKGSFSSQYGHTIKEVSRFGPRLSKFYTRVSVKHKDASTSTSYEVYESTLTVDANNLAWVYGNRSFNIDNILINDSTTASTLAQNLFNDLSSLRREIDFSTSYVPHLDIFDRISISYDTSIKSNTESFWNLSNWAEDVTQSADDLIWDKNIGDNISLLNREFKFLTISIDLDNLSCNFKAREL